MSTAARKARKRAKIKFVRIPKVPTTTYTSRTRRQQLTREDKAWLQADLAQRHGRNPLAALAKALHAASKKGDR